jgi:hypothetical protein
MKAEAEAFCICAVPFRRGVVLGPVSRTLTSAKPEKK